MKITQDIGIRICGTGSSVPERKISNDDMATIVETNDEWIRTRTGISNRHFADKETNHGPKIFHILLPLLHGLAPL